MTELNDNYQLVSVSGILNWIFLLLIFSIITVIGNYMGYRHPISESMIGMGILSLIALLGAWMERNFPFKIPSIFYILIIGITLALPIMPTSDIIIYYVSEVEIISIVTVFLAYVGIGMGTQWSGIKSLNWKALIVTMLIISAMYIGSTIVAQLL
ncbi:MAG: hypothetical protein IJG09_05185 [Methanobrevibacter sp.]|nr:hypothetical protein [Methanobrevibacter sp.]